jgi:phage baseplate assembly protein W
MDWSTAMSISINYPYTLDISGAVGSTSNAPKIYLDRVLTLLSTSVGQRPMLPNYGVDWSTSLFENDNQAQPAISAAIRSAIANWIPEVKVDNVLFGIGSGQGVEYVTLELTLPDNTTTNLTVNSNLLNYNGMIAG